MRVVDVEKIVEILGDIRARYSCFDIDEAACYHVLSDAIARINESSFVEPKRGKWIWDAKSKVFRCSECNHYPWRVNTCENDEIFTDLDRTNAYRFCPTCGADMRERESE